MHPSVLLATCLLLIMFNMWSCATTVRWLWRHRRTPIPRRKTRQLESGTPHTRVKPEWVRRKVVYLAIRLGSCRKVADVFNRWHGSVTVGKTWVAEVMKERADEIRRGRLEMRRRPPRSIRVRGSWSMDLTFVRTREGMTFTILGILDQGSRRILCLQAAPTKCAFALLGHLLLTISRFGLPGSLRTDNEGMFVSTVWTGTLRALSILHRRGPPAQPWRNGRIERFFGTLKPVMRAADCSCPMALSKALAEFGWFYNTIRPHQSLGALTPAEAWHDDTLDDVRRRHEGVDGEWVQALDGQLVGYRQ